MKGVSSAVTNTILIKQALEMTATLTPILSVPAASKVSFSVGPVHLRKEHYAAVKKEVNAGRLVCQASWGLASQGLFRRAQPSDDEFGRIFLRQDVAFQFTAPYSQGVIFHELTHAALHASGQSMPNHMHEILAYIAEAVYMTERFGSVLIPTWGDQNSKRISNTSAELAVKVLAGSDLSQSDVAPLLKAILAYPDYAKKYAMWAMSMHLPLAI